VKAAALDQVIRDQFQVCAPHCAFSSSDSDSDLNKEGPSMNHPENTGE